MKNKVIELFLIFSMVFQIFSGNFLMAQEVGGLGKIALKSKLDQGEISFVQQQKDLTSLEKIVEFLKTVNFLQLQTSVESTNPISEKIQNLDHSLGFTNDFLGRDLKILRGVKSIVLENIDKFDTDALSENNDWLGLYQLFISVLGDELLNAHMQVRGGQVKTIRNIIEHDLVFDANGWRDQIGYGFNPFLIAIVFDAISDYYVEQKTFRVIENKNKYFLLGFDTRAFGPEAAEIATRIFYLKGIKVIIANDKDQYTSATQIAYLMKKGKFIIDRDEPYELGAGAYITAGNASNEYNGIKVFLSKGDAVPKQMTDRISEIASEFKSNIENKLGFGALGEYENIDNKYKVLYQASDVYNPYIDFLMTKYDMPTLKKMIKSGKVFFDVGDSAAKEGTTEFLRRAAGIEDVDEYVLARNDTIPDDSVIELLKSAGRNLYVEGLDNKSIDSYMKDYPVGFMRRNLVIDTKVMQNFVGNENIKVGKKTVPAREQLAKYKEYMEEIYAKIDELLKNGEIQPDKVAIRHMDANGSIVGGSKNFTKRSARIGIFPMAANPVHAGHFEPAFNAILEHKLDKIYFVIAASDPRKPALPSDTIRYPMFKALVDRYPGIFEFTGIAKNTGYDGETNIFRLMKLNEYLNAGWYYMVGSDHAFVYKEQVIGTINEETDDKITIKVDSGVKVNKNAEIENIGGERTYNKLAPEYLIEPLSDGTVKITILDTVGKLDRNVTEGAPITWRYNEDMKIVDDTGFPELAIKFERANSFTNPKVFVGFIGRDPAELEQNLELTNKQISDSGKSGLNIEIKRVSQKFPFSSTEIRNAFKGDVSIAYLWAINPTTLVEITNIVEEQRNQGVSSEERLYSISDEVLGKMIALRNFFRNLESTTPFSFDISNLSNKELETLMKKGGEVNGVRFVEKGSENPKSDALAVVKKLVKGERVEIFIYGQKRMVRSDVTVIKMDASGEKVSAKIGGESLDTNDIAALLLDYNLSTLFSYCEKIKQDVNALEASYDIKIKKSFATSRMVNKVLLYWRGRFSKSKIGLNFRVCEVSVESEDFAVNVVNEGGYAFLVDSYTGKLIIGEQGAGLPVVLSLLKIKDFYTEQTVSESSSNNLVHALKKLKKRVGYDKENFEFEVNYDAGFSVSFNEKAVITFLNQNYINTELKKFEKRANDYFLIAFKDGSRLFVKLSDTECKATIFVEAPEARSELLIALAYKLLGKDNWLSKILKDKNCILKMVPKYLSVESFILLIQRMKIDTNVIGIKNVSKILNAA